MERVNGHRVGIYARISFDRFKDELGVERQIKECRELCQRREWQVAEVYKDDSKSAWKENAKRPAYERMLADLESGEINTLVAWHPDRLHRGKGLEPFIDAVEAARAGVATVQGGDYDLSTASGKMTARVVGAVARHESEHKSERIRAKVRELQENKEYMHGLRRRPFGYRQIEKGKPELEIDLAEAEVIRELADRYLAGEGLLSLTRDLNQRGIPTVSGGRWIHTTIRGMLIGPFIAGLRRLSGSEELVEAPWPAIIDAETHYRLKMKAAQQAQSGRHSAPKYLLTGIARCGKCEAPMQGVTSHAGPRYFCTGCRGVSIRVEPTEKEVAARVVFAVDARGFAKRLSNAQGRPAAVEDERRRLEERLDTLAQMVADGVMTRQRYERVQAPVQAQLDQLHEQDQERSTYSPLDRWVRGGLGADWEALSLDQRRAIVGALLERVVINPQGEDKTPRFDAARIVIPGDAWRM